MAGNNIMSLIVMIVIYSFIAILTLPFLFSFFPLLAVLLILLLVGSGISSVVNFLRSGITRAQTRRRFDEYGNRRTKATVMEINESDTAGSGQTDKRENR